MRETTEHKTDMESFNVTFTSFLEQGYHFSFFVLGLTVCLANCTQVQGSCPSSAIILLKSSLCNMLQCWQRNSEAGVRTEWAHPW